MGSLSIAPAGSSQSSTMRRAIRWAGLKDRTPPLQTVQALLRASALCRPLQGFRDRALITQGCRPGLFCCGLSGLGRNPAGRRGDTAEPRAQALGTAGPRCEPCIQRAAQKNCARKTRKAKVVLRIRAPRHQLSFAIFQFPFSI
jgi:hypothetical protein